MDIVVIGQLTTRDLTHARNWWLRARTPQRIDEDRSGLIVCPQRPKRLLYSRAVGIPTVPQQGPQLALKIIPSHSTDLDGLDTGSAHPEKL